MTGDDGFPAADHTGPLYLNLVTRGDDQSFPSLMWILDRASHSRVVLVMVIVHWRIQIRHRADNEPPALVSRPTTADTVCMTRKTHEKYTVQGRSRAKMTRTHK